MSILPSPTSSPAPGSLASRSPAPGSLASRSPAPGSLASRSPGALQTVLTLTDSDSTAAHGIQLDLRVIGALGLRGVSVVTAITWNTVGSKAKAVKLSRRVISGQMDALLANAAACTVGTLPSPEVVRSVMERLRRRHARHIVLHPVIFTRAGERVLTVQGTARLRSFLPGVSCLITDWRNARALCGAQGESLQAGEAARQLVERGAGLAVIQGDASEADMVCDGKELRQLPPTAHRQGACGFLSAATACRLALGDPPLEAYQFAANWLMEIDQSLERLVQ